MENFYDPEQLISICIELLILHKVEPAEIILALTKSICSISFDNNLNDVIIARDFIEKLCYYSNAQIQQREKS